MRRLEGWIAKERLAPSCLLLGGPSEGFLLAWRFCEGSTSSSPPQERQLRLVWGVSRRTTLIVPPSLQTSGPLLSSDYSGNMDLFGDIDDISSESDVDQRTPVLRQPVGRRRVPQNQHVRQRIPETRVRVEIPSIHSDLGDELYFVKLPRFLRIEPKPFDPQLYEDELEDEKVLYEEDKTRLKLKVENTIRWRVGQDEAGYKVKESNARIVKWSDGSMSLHLGSEVFDVYKVPLQDNHNQLFIREETGLRGQAIFKSRLTFRGREALSSSDSDDEGPEEDKAGRLLKAKKLVSDWVDAVQREAALAESSQTQQGSRVPMAVTPAEP
ncbi:hypothetical protein STEG23_005962 [Scotinomys teguina]